MFPLHEVPVFIEAKKHGKRYTVDLTTKLKIRCAYYNDKVTQLKLAKQYKLPTSIIRKILKE